MRNEVESGPERQQRLRYIPNETLEERAKRCRREYMKSWRKKNAISYAEYQKEYLKKYRKANPQKFKEYQAKYWERRSLKEVESRGE